MGLPISGFATCDDGYGWALAVSAWKSNLLSLKVLRDLIWGRRETVRGLGSE